MSLVCELTGKGRLKANKVSHSNIKTRRFKYPNVVRKKWYISEVDRSLTLTLSSEAFRTIAKRGGIVNALMKEKDEHLSERLLSIKKQIAKKRRLVGIAEAAMRRQKQVGEVEESKQETTERIN